METTNCGACGDRVPYGGQHECWVVKKYQEQDSILEICPVCFDPIKAPHWRCDRERHSD